VTAAADTLLRRAADEARRGDLASARRSCERALQQAPTSLPALRLRAVVLMQSGATSAAIAAFRRVLEREPADVESMANLAALLNGQGELEAAARILHAAIALRPSMAALHYNLGNVLMRLERIEEALARFEAALRIDARLALAHNNRGSALKRLGRLSEACEAFARAVALDPRLAQARNNLGIALAARGDWHAAVAELEEAVRLDPGNIESRGELAGALVEAGQFPRAFEEFERATALAPEVDSLWYNLGTALMRFGDTPRAVAVFEEALRRRPDDTGVLLNLAQAILIDGRPREALRYLARARELEPDAPQSLPLLVNAKLQLCDWQDLQPLVEGLLRVAGENPDDVPPLALAFVADDPAAQLAAARSYARSLLRGLQAPAVIATHRRPGRLRVAYVSPDFGEHPVAHSIVEVLERHDRSRLEVIGISVKNRAPTAIGNRIAAACDRFMAVSEQPDRQIGALLRQLDVDVAVDLAGYTMGARPRIYAARGARVQVGYLGYPGTTGSPWLDYLIADDNVIPGAASEFYSERIVRLPGCFFPSDTTQAVDPAPTRLAAGLPERGVVYACMTRPMRVLPEVFDAWMRILKGSGDSVLWLNAAGDPREALRAHAAARGVDPARLRFAARLESRSAYLGRLALADVCLDTFPYAGHSTVRDALWSGVPVVTREGRSFATRVAPSLLRAAGLADWIAADWSAYEALAVAAARDPSLVARARERLALRERLAAFDMRRLARDLEAAYEFMLEHVARGEQPSHFALAAPVASVEEARAE
jgi:protein O-GlcNAc transferase